MKKHLFLFLLFILNYQSTIAQVSETDSLENLVKKYQKRDTVRVNLLNKTAYKLYLKDFEKTLIYATEANELAEELNFLKGKSNSFRYIGIHYYMKANYSKALEYYQKSLKIEEELGNDVGIAKGCNNIGMIYRYLNDFPKSLEYLEKALQKGKEGGDRMLTSFSLNNIGNTYRGMENYPKALEYYQKSLKIKRELGSKLGIASSYHNIGKNYKLQKNYPKALEYLQKSLEIAIEIKTKSIEARNYTELGSVYLRQNKLREAFTYSQKSYLLAKEMGELNFQKESLEILSKSSEMLGLYEKAYKYHVAFKAINDSIYNNENNKKIAGLEYQYKYEKEKQEAELKQQKKDIIQAEEAKQQKTIRNSFIAGFALMLILALVVSYSFVQKQKANHILAEQKHIIENTNEELNQINDELQTTLETVNQQKEEITEQHQIVTKQKEHISASINYASRIQKAILPVPSLFEDNFSDYFILFKPRDVVSGDFYWAKKINNYLIYAAADCTGHGVPGAFVSMLGISFLNEIARRKDMQTPAQMLEELRLSIKTSLHQTGNSKNASKEGMDIALCILDTKTNILQYAGAYNPLYLIRNKELIETKATRNPISIFRKEVNFVNHEIQVEKGDTLYIFSDGYIDQFGGEKGYRFNSKKFKNLLIPIAQKPMSEQKEILDNEFKNWRGNNKQIDDVLVLGVKI